MARPELGTKRTCPNCGTKYYDLGRNPIVCPKCGTQFAAVAIATRARAAPEPEEEAVLEEDEAAVEIVSLEEADAEETGPEVVPDVEGEDLDEAVEELPDETFLEEEEEEDGITDIDIEVGGDEEER